MRCPGRIQCTVMEDNALLSNMAFMARSNLAHHFLRLLWRTVPRTSLDDSQLNKTSCSCLERVLQTSQRLRKSCLKIQATGTFGEPRASAALYEHNHCHVSSLLLRIPPTRAARHAADVSSHRPCSSTTTVIASKASDWWCGRIQPLDVHTHKILSAPVPKSKSAPFPEQKNYTPAVF